MKLEVKHVTKDFLLDNEKPLKVLDNISFETVKDEIISIIGPSGCGKTTLLRIIAGLEAPTKEEIVLNGSRIEKPTPNMGMIFQEYSLLPWCSVAKNISIGLEMQNASKEERVKKVRMCLELVGLSEFSDKYPYELSGGMRQKAAIARALTVDPELLLMDEPFGALDPRTRERAQNEILKLQEKTRKTILFVTHDIEEAVFLADRLMIFSASPGRIHEILSITLDRPRDKTSLDFRELRLHVLALFDKLEGPDLKGL
jgi:NitT/TauT family transport system ATP-binding protein